MTEHELTPAAVEQTGGKRRSRRNRTRGGKKSKRTMSRKNKTRKGGKRRMQSKRR